MRVFEMLPGIAPREQGRAHGETFRPLIAEVAAIREELCRTQGRFENREDVTLAATAHLPILERWSPALYDELVGIAEGAALSPERVVILNHYTDLRDLSGGALEGLQARGRDDGDEADECSLLYAASEAGVFLGQTWDTHASATPYVMMLHVPERGEEPEAWMLSITGCLGMIGLNAAGVAVGVNNLTSLDAQVGLVWSALVRGALIRQTATDAARVVLDAPVGSGHHYFIASPEGAIGIETSGSRKAIVYDRDSSSAEGGGDRTTFVHTNHAFDPAVAERTELRPTSTTLSRHAMLSEAARHANVDDEAIWAMLSSHEGYPRSVCAHLGCPSQPHDVSTCATIVMDTTRRSIRAATGCGYHARPTAFRLQP